MHNISYKLSFLANCAGWSDSGGLIGVGCYDRMYEIHRPGRGVTCFGTCGLEVIV
jgi:hypothetical protein